MADALDLLEHSLKIYEKSLEKPTKRRSFSKVTRNRILTKQNHKCIICGNNFDAKDFDHIDGNISNNSLENCQALCPNCHAKKTRNNKKRDETISNVEKNKEISKMNSQKLLFLMVIDHHALLHPLLSFQLQASLLSHDLQVDE